MAGVARQRRLVTATLVVTVLVVAAGNTIGVAAQVGALPVPPECPRFMLTLSPCIGYVTGLDNTSNSACCTAFTATAINSPDCLCLFFSTSSPLGIPMNRVRVRNLPATCKMSTSSIPQCTDVTVPFKPPTAGLPVTPPNAVPGSIPAPPTTPPAPPVTPPAPPVTPPAEFFPVTPTTGSPIPSAERPSPSRTLPFIRRAHTPSGHSTPNSSTDGSNQANPPAKTKGSASAAGVPSRPSACMGVSLAMFLAMICFM